MLPLTTKDPRGLGYRIKEKLSAWRRLIFSDKNSRNLFLFLLLNLSFAFVELLYGVWTNSLGESQGFTCACSKLKIFIISGLISDSFHMFFDCTGLLAGLAASVITKWKATDKYSYGYVRAEVIAGFVNSLFLLFISFFILSESVERLIEPPEVSQTRKSLGNFFLRQNFDSQVKHERLFVVSILGFIVNLVGIYAFQHGGAHGHSHGGGSSHSHSHNSHSIHEKGKKENF